MQQQPTTVALTDLQAYERLYEAYSQRIEDSGKTILLDDHVAEVLHTLALYANRSPKCKIPLHKGILLYGPTGVGKTKMMEALRDLERFLYGKGWRNQSLREIVQRVDGEKSAWPVVETLASARPLSLDDVGAEKQVKVYGTDQPVFVDLAMGWYEGAWSSPTRLRLFLTSNIPFEYTGDAKTCPWSTVYGPDARLFSRLAEMCTPLPFLGPDKRLLL